MVGGNDDLFLFVWFLHFRARDLGWGFVGLLCFVGYVRCVRDFLGMLGCICLVSGAASLSLLDWVSIACAFVVGCAVVFVFFALGICGLIWCCCMGGVWTLRDIVSVVSFWCWVLMVRFVWVGFAAFVYERGA